jgi:hypothetical protein
MKGNLDTLLPQRPTLTRGHHPAVPVSDAPKLYARLSDDDSDTCALPVTADSDALGASDLGAGR